MIRFEDFREQQHRGKRNVILDLARLKILRLFKPAGLTVCIFPFFVRFICLFVISEFASFLCGSSAVSELSPGVLSGGDGYLFCCARHFRTANSTQLVAIGRTLAPSVKLTWKATNQKRLIQSPAPIHLWVPRGRNLRIQPAKLFLWGSN
jgi:hypothetical protein